MGLKFRRGTTAQQSGSLAFGEPYVNTTLGTLVVGGPNGDIVLGASGTGSTGNFGAISGSGLDITGNANIAGNLTLGGQLTIGDATSDTVNVVASLSSSLIPSATNAFDLGSANYFWRDLYISTGSIRFVGAAGQIAGTLSNFANGLQMSGDLLVGYDPNTTIGVTVGRGKGSNTTFNTALGYAVLSSNTTGTSNTAMGASTMIGNTTGESNTAIGSSALAFNTTGNSNVAIGEQAAYLLNNFGNVAIGHRALNRAIDSPSNVAIGYEALLRMNGGSSNIAIGYQAGQYASGSSNTNLFIGNNAGPQASTVVNNQLYIGAGETPLLHGNFAQSELRINGKLEVRNNTVLSGSLTTVGHILPSATNTYDLGSETHFWRDIYVSTGSIRFVGAAGNVVGTLTNVGNGLTLDSGIVAKGNSSFGTSSLAITSVTGSLLVDGRIVANSITGAIAATNGVVSGSSQVTLSGTTGFDTFSGSIASAISASVAGATWENLNGKPAGIVSGSSQITSLDNSFSGLQTFNNINVNGTASFAYIQSTTGSSTSIGESFIVLNENTPASNFAGIKVVDSGSSFTTASFIYDGLNNNWVFEKSLTSGSDTSVAIFGPISQGGLGTELGLTQNKLPKAVSSHGHHIGDSNISDDGTTIVLSSNTEVTGSLTVTGGIIGSIAATNGVISGSSQLATEFEGRANSSKTIISGSSQLELDFEGRANSSKTIISGSSQLANDFEGRANASKTIISGSSQLETVFEGRANASKTIISGSSQLATEFEGRANASKTIFSGSSQVSLGSASGNIALATQTTGDYVASLVAGTNITLSNNSGENATPTIGLTNNAITIAGTSTSLGGTISAATIGNAIGAFSGSSQVSLGSASGNIALATQTTGDYVASLVAGTGVTLSNNSGENATPTIAIGQAVATSSNVQFNSLGIGMAASATAGRIDATNDIVAYSSSDIRFKENIKAIENPIQKIRQISGNTYDWKAENKIEHGYEGNDVGVIAQEIEAVLPQLVQTRDNGYKAVKYDKLVALLIEGIKEQQTQIDNLTIQLEELKKQKGL
jgi:hypothetical protein